MRVVLLASSLLAAGWAATANADEVGDLKARVEALEARLSALENGGAGVRPLVVSPPISDDAAVKMFDDIEVGVTGCERKSTIVRCGLVLSNAGLNQGKISINSQSIGGGAPSRAFFADGGQVNAALIKFGSVESSYVVDLELPSQVPIVGTLEFEYGSPAEPAQNTVTMLEIRLKAPDDDRFGSISFRDLAVATE